MTRDGLHKIFQTTELAKGEKDYILNFQFRRGGSFTRALYEAIGHADESNLARLAKGFPDEVAAFLAWTRGDLYDRASKIAGEPCD